jgi:predicted hydrolase (HD superfamily)
METSAKPIQTLLNEKSVKLSYDSASKVIIAKWIGFLKMDDLKRGCELMNNQIRTDKITRHISDQTELKVLAKELQEYIGGVWFDEVEKLGLRKIAILVAEDVFAQATVNKVNTHAQFRNLQIQTFGSLEKCYQWLKD